MQPLFRYRLVWQDVVVRVARTKREINRLARQIFTTTVVSASIIGWRLTFLAFILDYNMICKLQQGKVRHRTLVLYVINTVTCRESLTLFEVADLLAVS